MVETTTADWKDRMNVHENARLTPRGREILVARLERGECAVDVATAMGVSTSTVYKWRRRFRAEGVAGLRDRSARPITSPTRTADDLEAKVVALRKERRVYHRIAAEAGVSRTTVGHSKAERFIQSSLREWAYANAYETSEQRARELPHWLHHYNWHRPHAGIKGYSPISRAGLDVNNLMRLHN